MQREAMLQSPLLESLYLLERLITVASSGFNSAFFLSYRHSTRRRRIGALVLALVNIAFLLEALYSALPILVGLDPMRLILDHRLRLLIGLAPMLASFFITLLILRQLLGKRRR